MTDAEKIDVHVDNLVEVIFAERQKDGTIVEYAISADTANDLRYLEEEFVTALNSNGIMHLTPLRQAVVPPEVEGPA